MGRLPERMPRRCYGRPGAEVALGRFVTAAAVAPAACQTAASVAHPTCADVHGPPPQQDSPPLSSSGHRASWWGTCAISAEPTPPPPLPRSIRVSSRCRPLHHPAAGVSINAVQRGEADAHSHRSPPRERAAWGAGGRAAPSTAVRGAGRPIPRAGGSGPRRGCGRRGSRRHPPPLPMPPPMPPPQPPPSSSPPRTHNAATTAAGEASDGLPSSSHRRRDTGRHALPAAPSPAFERTRRRRGLPSRAAGTRGIRRRP